MMHFNASEHEQDNEPRRAALALLPFLLSNPPFIPASLTSYDVNRRHQILRLSPEDVEEYLVTDAYQTDYPTGPRTVELLRLLASQVEQLAVLDAGGGVNAVVGSIQYKSPERGVILVGVELGDTRQTSSPLLLLLLRLEGVQTESGSFKYDNLLPMHVVPGPWHASIDEATSAQKAVADGGLRRAQSEVSEYNARASTGSFKTAMSSYDPSLASSRPMSLESSTRNAAASSDDNTYVVHQTDNKAGANEEDAGDPEYITDPAEFWADVENDSEDGKKSLDEHSGREEESDAAKQKQAQEQEDRYWSMYDHQDPASPYKEEGRRTTQSPKPLALPEQEQMWSMASSGVPGDPTALIRDSQSDQRIGLDESKLRSAVSNPSLPSAPKSNENDRGLNGQRDIASRTDVNPVDSHTNNIFKDVSLDRRKTPDTSSAVSLVDSKQPLPSRAHTDEATFDKLEDRHLPHAPESVSGLSMGVQSVFETPADMDLADLEGFYRLRDLQRAAEVKERIQRAVHPELYADEEEQKSVGGQMPLDQEGDANGPIDPIEALSRAHPTVAVAEDAGRSRSSVPRSPSMEALRKLAEQNRMQGPHLQQRFGPSSGASLAGGFTNFLQLAPSVVADSEADTDAISTRDYISRLQLSVAEAREEEREQDVDNLSTKTQDSKQTEKSYFKDNGKPVDREVRSASQPSSTSGRPMGTSSTSLETSQKSRQHHTVKGLDDLDAFMFPGRYAGAKGHAIDSPGMDEDDPLVKEVVKSIQAGKEDGLLRASLTPSIGPSETFLPGAASDASVRPLRGSVSFPFGKAGATSAAASPSTVEELGEDEATSEIRSTSTNYGRASLDKGHPAPQFGTAIKRDTPMNTVTRGHTLFLMQELLRKQRQEALNMQRGRAQQQQSGSRRDEAPVVIVNDGGSPQRRAIAANQEEAAPDAQRAQRPISVRLNTASTDKTPKGMTELERLARMEEQSSLRQGTTSTLGGAEESEPIGGPTLDEHVVPLPQVNEEEEIALTEEADGQRQAIPSPLSPRYENTVSLSPANATAGQSKRTLDEDKVPNLLRPSHLTNQQARADASRAARKRHDRIQGIGARNEAVKMILKGAWKLMEETTAAFEDSTGNDGMERLQENDFLRIAREAVRECMAEKPPRNG